MSIKELFIEVNNPKEFIWKNIFEEIKEKIPTNKSIIKLNLIQSSLNNLLFHLILIDKNKFSFPNAFYVENEISLNKNKNINALIVPTGIGASIGGYAGDANPLAKLLSYSSEHILVNPNVVNGAVLTDIPSNLIYLEGFLLDQFLLGNIFINPKSQNKIGVIFDNGISEERLDYEINVLNACKAFFGIDIGCYVKTKNPIYIKPTINKFGFSSGLIENIESILEAALDLKNKGITAIAICTQIPDLDLNKNYISGNGIDPIGGIEAIISRAISHETQLPSAHAPILISEEKINYKTISPLSASEFIAESFLPSVINGLRFSPKISLANTLNELNYQSIDKIFLPYNSFGIPGILNMLSNSNLPSNVFLLNENKTSLDINPIHVNLNFNFINNLLEYIPEEDFNKAKISPQALKRPIEKIKCLTPQEIQ